MSLKTIKQNNLSWYHFNDLESQDFVFLKNNFNFHPLDLKDCGDVAQRSKIDVYKNYIFLTLQMPVYSVETNKIDVENIYIFCGRDYLVSIGRGKNKILNGFFFKVLKNIKVKENHFSKNSGFLLYQLLMYIITTYWKKIFILEQGVKKVEIDIEREKNKTVVYQIANLRKLMIQFKTILDPQRLVTNELSRLSVPFLEKDIGVYFDDVDDYIDKVWFSLESYQNRAVNLHEINESLISYKTNRIMTLLTFFSVALLPLTLLSGIYGMNINLPFSHHTSVVWGLFLALATSIIITLFILKKRDWL
ncbi:MAG: magnesium transporter CorA family protein [Candidatus Buchananbacteria bacterium]|nr:magnesium transporter CorA family protein [Candidatus Buchananbacteria bacterium]